jgi:hypothetical protein
MIHLLRIRFLVVTLSLTVVSMVYGQKIEEADYENKAQAYAILSAQYSKDAYFYAKNSFFEGSLSQIRQNCDTGLAYTQIALEYTTNALNAAHDTCEYARNIMLRAQEHQQNAILAFKVGRNLESTGKTFEISRAAMYDMGNAIADAYKASMFFDTGAKEIPKKAPLRETPVAEPPKESARDITRLESDEFSYMTVKELYGKRLAEIDDELIALEAEAKKSSGAKLDEINNAMAQLRFEENKVFKKMKNSEDRLISVKTDISEEMMKVIDKDIFTTEREGFYNDNVPVPHDIEMPEGLVYRVQIGFFRSQLPPQHFEGIFPLSSQKVDDVYYRYVAGNFSNYKDVKSARNAIAQKGYTDSFVVAYFNGKKIPISEALEKEKLK